MTRTWLSLTFLLSACEPAATTAEAMSPRGNDAAPAATTAKVAAPGGSPDASTSVATWEGGALTYGDIEAGISGRLIRLQIDYLEGRYQAESQALEAMIGDKITEAEAKARGMDAAALLKAEIDDKVATPTEEELRVVYEQMKRRFGGKSFEEVREQLVQGMMQQQKGQRFAEYMTELRDKYKVSVTLPRPELPKIEVSKDDDPMLGDPNAQVTIIQFAEFQCPYCGKSKETVDRILKEYEGKVNMVARDFPLGFHDRAIPAAVAANCAGEQGKYWEMYDILMANQRALGDEDLAGHATKAGVPDMDKWTACLSDPAQAEEVNKDFQDGSAVGVTGTPAFFINGVMLSGAQPYEKFKEIIDQELGQG